MEGTTLKVPVDRPVDGDTVRLAAARLGLLGVDFVDIGSQAQPFKIFLPNIESDEGQELVGLLEERYISGGSDGRTVSRPRRSYAYVSGKLKTFNNQPEIVVSKADQVRDTAP